MPWLSNHGISYIYKHIGYIYICIIYISYHIHTSYPLCIYIYIHYLSSCPTQKLTSNLNFQHVPKVLSSSSHSLKPSSSCRRVSCANIWVFSREDGKTTHFREGKNTLVPPKTCGWSLPWIQKTVLFATCWLLSIPFIPGSLLTTFREILVA